MTDNQFSKTNAQQKNTPTFGLAGSGTLNTLACFRASAPTELPFLLAPLGGEAGGEEDEALPLGPFADILTNAVLELSVDSDALVWSN